MIDANKAFFILLFSFVIALVGLGTIFFKTIPFLLSHAVYVCQETFSNILFSISHSTPLLLITLATMILLLGFITLWVQALETRSYLRKHMGKKISIPSEAVSIIEEMGLRDKVNFVKDKSKFSFCYGLFQPKICLSTGLLKSLSTNELRAVLLHESYHIKNHDPLKIILSKTASIMFFFIPILKDFQKYYGFSKEIAADKLVINNGYKQPLLSALSKLLISDQPKFISVAALASVDDLEKRILYLTGNQKSTIFKSSLINISLSAFVVLFSLALVNTPVYAVKDHEGSMENSLFICPFGDSCTVSCKSEEKKTNFSKHILYTPAQSTK